MENQVHGNRCFGKKGADLVLKVPKGTVIKDFETGKIICDLSQDNQKELVLRGGKGGKGNVHFATSTRQVPDFAIDGEKGKEVEVVLEFQLSGLRLVFIHPFDDLNINPVTVFFHDILLRIFPEHIHRSFATGIFALACIRLDTHQLEKMFGRSPEMVLSLIPPFLYLLERIAVGRTIHQYATFLHPVGNILVSFLVERLHVRITHQQDFRVFPVLGIRDILDVHQMNRYATLQERKRLFIEIRELRINISGHRLGRALEHQRIGHQDTQSF